MGHERKPPDTPLHALGEARSSSGTVLARPARLVHFLLVIPDEYDIHKSDDVHDSVDWVGAWYEGCKGLCNRGGVLILFVVIYE